MIRSSVRTISGAGILLFLLSACHREAHFPEGVVATISGKPVSSEELRETARFIGLGKLASRPLDSWSPILASLVLRETVYDRLLMQKAQQAQIEVTADEISREQRRLSTSGAPSSANSPYLPPEAFIKRKLILEKAAEEIAPETSLSGKTLKTYYQIHRDRFTLPERALVKEITVRSEDEGKAILTALAAGNSFEALAKAKSLSPEGKNGGLLPPFAMGEMPTPFNKAFSMKPGEVSPLISSPYGYHILTLVSIIPSHLRPFSSVKEEIRKTLLKQSRKSTLDAWFSRELQRNPVVILPHYRHLLSFPEG